MLKLMSGEKKMPWRVHIDDKRRDLFLELTDTEEGFPLLRAESQQPVDVLTAFRTYCHGSNRKIYDPNVAECDYMKQLGVNLVYGYQKTFNIGPVCPRDLYFYLFYNQYEDGSIAITFFDSGETDHNV